MRALLDRHLGEGWLRRAEPTPRRGPPSTTSPTRSSGPCGATQRAALVDWVRERTVLDRLSRGDAREYVEAAARAFDPDVLTIGFARRLATYKRLAPAAPATATGRSPLLADEPAGAARCIAGKAHPRDDEGKRLVQHLFARQGLARGRRRAVVFLRRLRPRARPRAWCRAATSG